ncbi:DUF4856 domain-containing protein [Robiginitalea sp. M366]|uniref:DUF4856 domain-containing protein n=1 Tax=Robiginitalea aestuariiviva TaxID=3036903 RepID=UPI00240E3C9F|nr:DUF4856 domain-containing protein [Robiginitalea aestuariiviva]MDG1572340.1 DUF4856 domain-containing protein [Robiginitalea aestuariiviva]
MAFLALSCSKDESEDPVAATCSDGIQNGDETGVDCGGSSCTPCQQAVEAPLTYTFERDGASTVDFNGQTTRLLMGEEILVALMDETRTAETLLSMYAHQQDAADFQDTQLNASDKNLKSKTAASVDFFAANATDQALIRADFEGWVQRQVDEVFPNWFVAAAPGVAGQIADGTSTRYITTDGLEMNQLFNKSLIGALMLDQTVNNYLSPAVLDAGNNRTENDNQVLEAGKPYTIMEHKWDEAYGYVFGLNADPANPNADLGADSFLNKYLGRVEGDSDFQGIADEIYDAFKLGRAAIAAGDYTLRDEQAALIRLRLSEIMGIRAVYYLNQAKLLLEQPAPEYGTIFHDLSEGYGFIYSLQFTRKPGENAPYFSKAEVDAMLTDLMDDGANGLWDVTPATLGQLATDIAARFSFTLEQAGN